MNIVKAQFCRTNKKEICAQIHETTGNTVLYEFGISNYKILINSTNIQEKLRGSKTKNRLALIVCNLSFDPQGLPPQSMASCPSIEKSFFIKCCSVFLNAKHS